MPTPVAFPYASVGVLRSVGASHQGAIAAWATRNRIPEAVSRPRVGRTGAVRALRLGPPTGGSRHRHRHRCRGGRDHGARRRWRGAPEHDATTARPASEPPARASTRVNPPFDPSARSDLWPWRRGSTGVDAPPPDPDPAAPGQVVEGGADQSDPFLLLDGTHYFLYTSGIPGDPTVNVPVTSATRFGRLGPGDRCPPPCFHHGSGPASPGLPTSIGSAPTYVLYFTALVRDSHPAMECIGDAVGTSPTGPSTPSLSPSSASRLWAVTSTHGSS